MSVDSIDRSIANIYDIRLNKTFNIKNYYESEMEYVFDNQNQLNAEVIVRIIAFV